MIRFLSYAQECLICVNIKYYFRKIMGVGEFWLLVKQNPKFRQEFIKVEEKKFNLNKNIHLCNCFYDISVCRPTGWLLVSCSCLPAQTLLWMRQLCRMDSFLAAELLILLLLVILSGTKNKKDIIRKSLY